MKMLINEELLVGFCSFFFSLIHNLGSYYVGCRPGWLSFQDFLPHPLIVQITGICHHVCLEEILSSVASLSVPQLKF